MPGRNLEKIYVEHTYYHVYNRGINKQPIFYDEEDYTVFLNLFKRYLGEETVKDPKNRRYPNFYGEIELLAFCLMPNHFHALIYQSTPDAMTKLFKHISTTYSMYFNKKYQRVGPVFQSRFRAAMILTDSYLEHISRYIHLNPKSYQTWQFSSLPYYTGNHTATWLKPQKIMDIFHNDKRVYAAFVADYESHKDLLEDVTQELALP